MSTLGDWVRVHADYVLIGTFCWYPKTLSATEFKGDRLLNAEDRVGIFLKGSPATRIEHSCCQLLLAKFTLGKK